LHHLAMQNPQTMEAPGCPRHIRNADLEELAAAQPDKNRRYVQLRPGHAHGELVELRLGDVQVFRERVDVGLRIEAEPLPSLVPVAVISSGPGAMTFCGEDLQPGALVQATGGHWDSRADRGVDYVCCVFDREHFEETGFDLCGHPIDPAWLRSAVRRADPAAVARLTGRLLQLLSGVSLPPRQQPGEVARLLESELLELTIAALTSAEDRARSEPGWRRQRAVKRALEYLDGDPQPPPTIPQLCRVAGVSERTLEYGFRERLGVTPVRYIKVLRLNRARSELNQASPRCETVASVALRHGFIELGRFACEYRQLFGERPSETLRRS
jgi:AraC family ethanolamine operon transcriptional activator